jgi:hypothetical protein
MDFRGLDKEEIFRAEGTQVAVGSGGRKWDRVKPEELDLENGFFRRYEEGVLVVVRFDWIEVRSKQALTWDSI